MYRKMDSAEQRAKDICAMGTQLDAIEVCAKGINIG